MGRTIPTKGNREWFQNYLQALITKLTHDLPTPQRESIMNEVKSLNSALNPLHQLDRLNRFSNLPNSKLLSKNETAHMEYNDSWMKIVFEDIAGNFGKHGTETVSSVEEAVCYSYTFARLFGSQKIYYRGEHHYGYKLESRAERYMTDSEKKGIGLSEREIKELRRFQIEVRRSSFIKKEIKGKGWFLPNRNNPSWLPIMQHYDDSFGTRLLDLTSSIYTGLYFACINWNGEIDTSKDGLLYLFLGGGTGMHARGFYYDKKNVDFDENWDEIAPKNLRKSFAEWESAEYFRIYKSSFANPREIAQDGLFLVRGDLDKPHQYGQGFKFRIPADAKMEIAKQLWLSGYTPERILRGSKGISSKRVLGSILGMS